MCYIGCQNMRENTGCETDILITSPLCSYHCFDTASSQLFYLSGWLCKTEHSSNYHRHWAILFHSSYKAILPQMISTTSPSTSSTHPADISLRLFKEMNQWQSNLQYVYCACHKIAPRLHLFSNLVLCLECISHMLLLQIFCSKCDFVW